MILVCMGEHWGQDDTGETPPPPPGQVSILSNKRDSTAMYIDMVCGHNTLGVRILIRSNRVAFSFGGGGARPKMGAPLLVRPYLEISGVASVMALHAALVCRESVCRAKTAHFLFQTKEEQQQHTSSSPLFHCNQSVFGEARP